MFFFFNGASTTEIYTLSLHDALPIFHAIEARLYRGQRRLGALVALGNALAGLVVGLAMLLALWLAAGAWEAGRLSGPLMVMMPVAMLAMSEALAPLPAAFTWLGATRGAAGRLNELEARARA